MNAAGQARAHGAAVLSAAIRTTPADFFVEELDAFAPSGSGEHLLLTVEKAGMNTTHAARRIAQWAGVAESAVGYAGMKDRHAVTRQRFSVQLPGKADPDIATLETRGSGLASRETLRVLSAARHARKLPRGAHAGNRFVLVLRDVDGAAEAIDTRLSTIAAEGVPNSFGGQRFGRAGDNIAQALAMFGGRRVRREERSMLLSAARSALFNRVLAHRVEAGTWNVGVDGEVWMLDGTRSVFGPVPMDAALRRRVDAFDIHPTGPLWGRGALRSEGDAGGIEEATLGDAGARALRDGLERAGLSQERRSLRLRPVDLVWTWPAPDMLELRFSLAPGAYATSLLAELGEVRDAHAALQGRSSDGMD